MNCGASKRAVAVVEIALQVPAESYGSPQQSARLSSNVAAATLHRGALKDAPDRRTSVIRSASQPIGHKVHLDR